MANRIDAFLNRSELTRVLGAFRKEFWVIGVFSGVANLLMLVPTIYMLQVFDRVLHSGSNATLLVVSILCAALLVIMSLSEWFRSRVLVRAGIRLDNQLSTRVFNASFASNLDAAKANPVRSFSDLIELRQFLTGNGTIAFFDAPWTPIYIAVLFLLHPILGWMAIGFVIVQALFARFGHKGAVKPAEELTDANLDETRFLQNKIRGAEVLQALGMTENLRNRWIRKRAISLGKHAVSHAHTHKVTSISKFIRYTQASFSLAVGAMLAIAGELSMGGMIAANVLATRALAPIDLLVSSWKGFLTAKQAFLRLETLLDSFPESESAISRMDPVGKVELRDVVATVEGRQEPILKGVSYLAPVGSVTAVLGPSGSGKSTLAKVLVDIWPQTHGEVLLDDMPISGWRRDELGPHMGYLPQDIELFDGTIAENISRFSELDPDQVVKAAKTAGLHEMILRFPKGYDTPIGEAGGLLSGGQKQRIGLARALYGDPKVIVLDEPNANLDDAGEQALMAAVQTLKTQGRTVFLISHRPTVLSVADRLLILANGQVQASGPKEPVLRAIDDQRKKQQEGTIE